jgi:ubiquinone/menaquinone biosynthesis C-methylase UbiE
MTDINPMSTPEPWSLVSGGYVTDTKPLFEQYCKEALRLSGYDGSGKVLDVACGPGTLSLLIHEDADEIQAIDFSQGMLDCFNHELAQQGIGNITTFLMDGQSLAFADNAFDWAFSIFGLMFFPDRVQGFREMYRTLKSGGRAAVTSWAPVSDSPLMQLMFGAMGAAFPKKPEADSGKILNLEDPDNFKREMEQAGFTKVSITHFDGSWTLTDVEEFFDSMVRGSAPIVMLKNQLGGDVWTEKRAIMLEWLKGRIPHVPVTLHSRAYIGLGHK